MDFLWPLVTGLLTGAAGFVAARHFYRLGLSRGKKRGADEFLDFILAGGYDQRVRAFRELNPKAQKHQVVFVGDSITQDYPLSEHFPERVTYNRGIGGDTTVGLSRRLEESVFALEPETVVLLIGTNDLALLHSTPEEVVSRIGAILAVIRARLPQTRILLESVYPVRPDAGQTTREGRSNEDIRTINAKLAALPDIRFMDLYSRLADSEGRLRSEFTVEGLHINQAGYSVITETLRPLLDEKKDGKD